MPYVDLCAAEGLQPVGSGVGSYHGDDCTMYSQLNCMPLDSTTTEKSDALTHAASLGEVTGMGWRNFVTFDLFGSGQGPGTVTTVSYCEDCGDTGEVTVSSATASFDAPLHPLCALEHRAPPPPPPPISGALSVPAGTPQWDSGTSVNANGNTYTLYLLPTEPGADFPFIDECIRRGVACLGAQHYADLCAAAGLFPVTAWDQRSLSYRGNGAVDYRAIPISTDIAGAEVAGSEIRDTWRCWLSGVTGWDDALTFDVYGSMEGALISCHGGAPVEDASWPMLGSSVRPVCMLEHDSSGGKGR
jgi:hypothetical protein